jgi:hypothetical protein
MIASRPPRTFDWPPRFAGAAFSLAISDGQTATTAEAAEVILRLAEWYEDAGLRRRGGSRSERLNSPTGGGYWRWRPGAERAAD